MAEGLGWDLFESAGCAEALTVLRREHIPVVLCEENLPDGNWRLLLDEVGGFVSRPHVIVASRLADNRLWAEVLNLGAYDLLMLPFDDEEVQRVVRLAWESKCREVVGRTAARKPADSEFPRQSAVQGARAAYGD